MSLHKRLPQGRRAQRYRLIDREIQLEGGVLDGGRDQFVPAAGGAVGLGYDEHNVESFVGMQGAQGRNGVRRSSKIDNAISGHERDSNLSRPESYAIRTMTLC